MKPIQQLKYPDGFDVVKIGRCVSAPEGLSEEDTKEYQRRTFEVVQANVIDDILDKLNELVDRVNKLG